MDSSQARETSIPLTALEVVRRARRQPCIRTWNLQKSLKVAEQLLMLEDKSILPDIEEIINGAVKEVKEIIQNHDFGAYGASHAGSGDNTRLQSYDREGVEDILQQIATMQEVVSRLKVGSTPRKRDGGQTNEWSARLKEVNKENVVDNKCARKQLFPSQEIRSHRDNKPSEVLKSLPEQGGCQREEGVWRGSEEERDWLSQRLAQTLLSQLIPEVGRSPAGGTC
eukprot:768063-Hanusia_phi.AAC.8